MTSDGLSEHDHQHKQTNNDDAMDLSRIYGLRAFSAVGPMVCVKVLDAHQYFRYLI